MKWFYFSNVINYKVYQETVFIASQIFFFLIHQGQLSKRLPA